MTKEIEQDTATAGRIQPGKAHSIQFAGTDWAINRTEATSGSAIILRQLSPLRSPGLRLLLLPFSVGLDYDAVFTIRSNTCK
jgi:hypothetical protein